MPVSIVPALMLWMTMLAPASTAVPASAVDADRQIATDRSDLGWSSPVPVAYDQALLDADDREEETDDGEPDGLAAGSSWLADFVLTEGRVSPIGREAASFRNLDRAKILRC